MRTAVTPDLLRRAVRARICSRCDRCTPGYENVSCDVARPCEGHCALFQTLPALRRAAVQMDPMLRSPRQVLSGMVHQACRARRPADCVPLKRHGQTLVRVVSQTVVG
jgi:hypothetical protein